MKKAKADEIAYSEAEFRDVARAVRRFNPSTVEGNVTVENLMFEMEYLARVHLLREGNSYLTTSGFVLTGFVTPGNTTLRVRASVNVSILRDFLDGKTK